MVPVEGHAKSSTTKKAAFQRVAARCVSGSHTETVPGSGFQEEAEEEFERVGNPADEPSSSKNGSALDTSTGLDESTALSHGTKPQYSANQLQAAIYPEAVDFAESAAADALEFRFGSSFFRQLRGMTLFPDLGIDEKSIPEALQHPKDESLGSVKEAETKEVTINKQARTHTCEEWQSMTLLPARKSLALSWIATGIRAATRPEVSLLLHFGPTSLSEPAVVTRRPFGKRHLNIVNHLRHAALASLSRS